MSSVVCGALVVDGDSFIVIQEAEKSVRGKWNIPGGHAEPDEDLFTSAIREVKEETNLDIKLEGLLGIYQHKSPNGNNVVKVVFTASAITFDLSFPEDEIMNAKWIEFDDFLKLSQDQIRTADLKNMIDDYRSWGANELDLIKVLDL